MTLNACGFSMVKPGRHGRFVLDGRLAIMLLHLREDQPRQVLAVYEQNVLDGLLVGQIGAQMPQHLTAQFHQQLGMLVVVDLREVEMAKR